MRFVTSLNAWLASVHHFNHSHLTLLSALLMLLMGFFVYLKNKKSEINQIFLLITCVVTDWYAGNFTSMVLANNFEAGFLGFLIGYSSAPFMSVTYYHFYYSFTKKKHPGILFFLYLFAFLQLFLLWFVIPPYAKIGAWILDDVGVVWNRVHPFAFVFFLSGMIFYIVLSSITGFSFLRSSAREAVTIKKQQLKAFAAVFLLLMFGWIEWLVIFCIDLHIAWIIMPLFVFYVAFAIIRYRMLDIETVFHRTMLWLLASSFIVIPIGLALYFTHPWFSRLSWWQMSLVFMCFLFFSISYYVKIQDRIDKFFHRKKYAAYEALGKINSRLISEIDVVSIAQKLFFELRDTFYIRNALLLMENNEKSDFEETGHMGFENFTKDDAVPSRAIAILPSNSGLIAHFRSDLKTLEKNQIQLNPKYDNIRDETLHFFDAYTLEVLIPVVLEEKLTGLLGLGKKEAFGGYDAQDIRILENLGRHIGLVLNSALRRRDLIEKEFLTSVADGIDDGLILFNKEGKILWANAKTEKITGTASADIMDKYCYKVIPSETKDDFSSLMESAIAAKPITFTRRYLDKTGQEYFYELAAYAIKDKNGNIIHFLHVIRDLTQRVKLEEKLIQSAKFAVVGRMAADVAHEINNPLMIISGTAELLRDSGSENEKTKTALTTILEQCKRSNNILRRLLKFSKPPSEILQQLDVNLVVKRVIEMIENQFLLSNIVIKKDLCAEMPYILANETEMEEVLLNILNNSKEAIKKAGNIEIRTSQHGGFIKIEVKDSGIGMDKQILDRAMEPFFTTKEKGTGLGLSISFNIIQSFSGTLTCASSPGEGTLVTIMLPVLRTTEKNPTSG